MRHRLLSVLISAIACSSCGLGLTSSPEVVSVTCEIVSETTRFTDPTMYYYQTYPPPITEVFWQQTYIYSDGSRKVAQKWKYTEVKPC